MYYYLARAWWKGSSEVSGVIDDYLTDTSLKEDSLKSGLVENEQVDAAFLGQATAELMGKMGVPVLFKKDHVIAAVSHLRACYNQKKRNVKRSRI